MSESDDDKNSVTSEEEHVHNDVVLEDRIDMAVEDVYGQITGKSGTLKAVAKQVRVVANRWQSNFEDLRISLAEKFVKKLLVKCGAEDLLNCSESDDDATKKENYLAWLHILSSKNTRGKFSAL